MRNVSLKYRLGARIRTLLGLAVIFAAVYGKAQQDVVALDSGRVSGIAAGTVTAYKGIPYAAPPVGELRWRAPQPVQSWSETREAAGFGADCMQKPFPGDPAALSSPPAEDCLYVNVWRPKSAKAGDKLPVMVWIYGGALTNGGSSSPLYDGTRFAEQGIVLISFNYRVGRFGFFAFPALTKEDADGLLGNYGFMDQIAALKWVKRNAAAFGGDAGQVTIAGESAGGYSSHMLLTSPLAEGLFARAIIESGGGRDDVGGLRYLSGSAPGGIPSAEAVGVKFAEGNGIRGTGEDALRRLRGLSAKQIAGELNMGSMWSATYSGPIIDGKVVLADPQTAYVSGAGARVPLLIGANNRDLSILQATTKQEVFDRFGLAAARAAATYDPSGSASLDDVLEAVGSDQMMVEPARFVAATFASRGVPAYEYRFSYVAQSMKSAVPGAVHGAELPFVFNTLAAQFGQKATAQDRRTAAELQKYWVAFIKTGAPNVSGQPVWPRYSVADDKLLEFTQSGPVSKPDPWMARLDLTSGVASGLNGSKPVQTRQTDLGEQKMEGIRAQLIGAWKLVSYEERPVDGSASVYPMTEHPVGIIMYTPDGYMSAQLSSPDRKPFASGDWFDGSDDDYKQEAKTYIAYTGEFHVDEKAKTLTHSMFVSLFPNWIGQTQPRVVHIAGDELDLSTAAPITSGGRLVNSYLKWKRASRNNEE